MRGSLYYQSAQLCKIIFKEGSKKLEKIDQNHDDFQKISSYKTMESYRNIWNNFFHYLREHWSIKDVQMIQAEHVVAYMDYKIEYYPSKQYLEKISSALGKLEIALTMFAKYTQNTEKIYDFAVRQDVLNEARNLEFVASNYHNRAYIDPENLISNLSSPLHQLVATIQYEGGARIEGVALIKKSQLLGIRFDDVTNTTKMILYTREKGGKEGDVLIAIQTYKELEKYLFKYGDLKINRQAYYKDLKQAALVSSESLEGSHGLRWNFAKRRMFEYGQAGYSYEESLQQVSYEMKHNRADITCRYLI